MWHEETFQETKSLSCCVVNGTRDVDATTSEDDNPIKAEFQNDCCLTTIISSQIRNIYFVSYIKNG